MMALIGMVYALHVEDDAQHVAALTYAGGALGSRLPGIALALFVFWEVMAISSVLLVLLRRERIGGSGRVPVPSGSLSGVVLLAGIVLHWSQTGSLAFGDMGAYSGDCGVWADSHRVSPQRGGAAAGRLASRRVPSSDRHRRGLS